MPEGSTTYVLPEWLYVGAVLRKPPESRGNYWIRDIELGYPGEEAFIRVLKISLGETLRLPPLEVMRDFEPSGRRSTLPPKVPT
jgi:hypothetical protein